MIVQGSAMRYAVELEGRGEGPAVVHMPWFRTGFHLALTEFISIS